MNSSHLDPQLVEKIVHEVKSQGVFDDFRKDTLADVDTKPAYQNLRQRVENTVKKFLADQKWTPETNKYQLRERLRRHITESGFLDVGVERIVDQVVNPKIGSIFQPRIEEIAYKYLGIAPPPQIKYEPPPPPLMHPLPPLPLNGTPLKVETSTSLLPNDLEQVSPDSDKATLKSEYKEESLTDMEVDEKLDEDDESPPFEPLVKDSKSPPRQENPFKEEANRGQLLATAATENLVLPSVVETCTTVLDADTQDTSASMHLAELDSEKEAAQSQDIAAISQDSQLSQVSSDSHISMGSRDKTKSPIALESAAVNISEEAQMPKFNENSSEPLEGESTLHFDIKKDEIRFEGTERKSLLLPPSEEPENNDQTPESLNVEKLELVGEGNEYTMNTNDIQKLKETTVNTDTTFQIDKEKAQEEADVSRTPVPDFSFGSSQEETDSAQLTIVKKAPQVEEESSSGTPLVPSSQHDKDIQYGAKQPTNSLISSRHKKHSKDKRQRHENEKERNRHREKERDRSSKSKHKSRDRNRERERDRDKERKSDKQSKSFRHSSSSGSTKYTSTKHKGSTTEIAAQKSEKTNSNSNRPNATSSCSNSSSRSELNGQRRSESEKKPKGTSSSTTASKEHTFNSSGSKRNGDRKSNSITDDHSELKDKTYRRKSTDSNDDKNPEGGALITPTHKSAAVARTKSKSSNSETKTSSTKSTPQNGSQAAQNGQPHHSKVVILNDILQHPATNFIELETHMHSQRVQVVTSNLLKTATTSETIPATVLFKNETIKEQNLCREPTCTANFGRDVREDSSDLFFFEELKGQFTARLELLSNVMGRCRNIMNCLNTDPRLSLCDTKHDQSQSSTNSTESGDHITTATLLVDCIHTNTVPNSKLSSIDKTDFEEVRKTPPRKRFKYDEEVVLAIKGSPTSSEVSVNSKENEAYDKYTTHTMVEGIDIQEMPLPEVSSQQNNIAVISKLTQQQRYNSEDLYKPRPILGQRSRRRGVDSVVQF